MAAVLVASGVVATSSSPSPWTVTLPSSYTTVAGDCIVVGYAASNNFGTPVFSGAGATWDNENADLNPEAGLAVGWGCSGGNTTISVSYHSAQTIALAIGIWKGLLSASDPVSSSFVATSGGTSVTTVTAGSPLPYTTNQLLVGAGTSQVGSTPTVTSWSNGGANTNVAAGSDSGNSQFVSLDMGSSLTGTSTSVTYGATSSKMRAAVAALTPLATDEGNMLLVMGQ